MIDEQRLNPLNFEQAKSDKLLKKAMIYERARARIKEAAQKVSKDRLRHLDAIRESGEEFDSSFDVALDELRGAKNRLGAKSDELWKQMKECGESFGPGLERLANAVLAKAAYDYEVALCGGFTDNEAEMRLIEKFARCGAEVYTTMDFSDVLGQIRRIYREEWKPTVEKVLDELRQETERKYRFKCPLCGGGLYYVHSKGQNDLVRCTTCGLFYIVKKKKGKAAARHEP